MPKHVFLDGVCRPAADAQSADYVVLPVPYERTVSYGRGTANGPDAILGASLQLEDFDVELLRPLDFTTFTLPAIDCAIERSDASVGEAIHAAAAPVFARRAFLLTLGGEHSLTYPLVRAARETYPSLSVLQIDAHSDLRDTYLGDPLSHACVMRRIRDLGADTVHVGVRSMCRDEYALAMAENIPIYWARDMAPRDRSQWVADVLSDLREPLYISVDTDALDPSLAPGTGTPEPGGLDWYDITELLYEVIRRRRVIGVDIVETAPMTGSTVTEFSMARLATKMLLYHFYRDELA